MQVFIYETCPEGLPSMENFFPLNATSTFSGYTNNNQILTHALEEYRALDYPDGLIIARSEVISSAGNGFNNVIDLVRKIVPNRTTPAIAYLSRYLDRCDQTRWLFRIDFGNVYSNGASRYDVFESFNPYSSQVFYLTPSAIRLLQADMPIMSGVTAEQFLRTRINEGKIRAYSTVPDVFSYNLTNCIAHSENFTKTMTCSMPSHLNDVSYPALLFKNVTVFWVFIVIFISVLAIIFYRFMRHKMRFRRIFD
jgi:hypothetical protein